MSPICEVSGRRLPDHQLSRRPLDWRAVKYPCRVNSQGMQLLWDTESQGCSTACEREPSRYVCQAPSCFNTSDYRHASQNRNERGDHGRFCGVRKGAQLCACFAAQLMLQQAGRATFTSLIPQILAYPPLVHVVYGSRKYGTGPVS